MKIRTLDDLTCEVAEISSCLGVLSGVFDDECFLAGSTHNRNAMQEALHSLKQHLDRVCDELDDTQTSSASWRVKR